jgi:NAD(P)-dependent dehydrogenase (short-subunit alcohol dehydrogenase family)
MQVRDFEGRIVLVTGASSGLGQSLAVGAARRGAKAVIVNYASSLSGAEATARAVEAAGAEAVIVKGDVSSDADCRAIADAAAPFGRIDALFNNAGVTVFASDHSDLDAVNGEDFLKIYRVNLVGAFQMVRACRPLLEACDLAGAVVNTSSIAGVMGIGSSVPYAASKGAMNTMTLSLARALAPKIRVNAVCPGFIDTPWFDKAPGQGEADYVRDKLREGVIRSTPLQVASTPDDIADTALTLGSPLSRHVTGETLIVDAGTHLGPAAVRRK